MAFICGPSAHGRLDVEVVDEWPTGERFRVALGDAGAIYMNQNEMLRHVAQCGAALESAGCTPVEVTVTDESDGAA